MRFYVYGGTQFDAETKMGPVPEPVTPAICGSEKGLWKHRYHQEPRCDKCREFANAKRRANYHANKNKTPKTPAAPTVRRLETIAKLEKAKKLFAAGASQHEVHRKTGLSRMTIRRHLPGNGWTLKQAAEYGNALRATPEHNPNLAVDNS